MSNMWNAIFSTLIISLLPNLILIVIPSSVFVKQQRDSFNFQNIFLTFAAGGLLGDVFLHILPHLFKQYGQHNHEQHEQHEQHEHEHGSDHHHGASAMIGIAVVLGYLLFFMVERFTSCLSNKTANSTKEKDEEDDYHVRGYEKKNNKSKGSMYKRKFQRDFEESIGSSPPSPTSSTFTTTKSSIFNRINVTAWLNLLADMMHNFTDGVAIGASFSTNKSNGLAAATVMSVMFHEIPHEIGDFSILVESGLSKFEAIQAQFITAIAAFAGTFVGILFQRNEFAEDILLAVTSGGFIYIAASSMIPKVHSTTDVIRNSEQVILESLVFLLGLGFMFAVMFLEDEH